VNDANALAISPAIPAMWTIVLWVIRRRVDWIGLLGMFGFAVALAVSVLSGEGSLPLKLYHPAVAGTTGILFLISVLLRKPLLITLLRTFKLGDPQRFNMPLVHKKFTIVTAVFGVVLLIDTVIQVFMALTLSTGTYLIASRAITLTMLAILFVIVRWSMRRKK
jgi:hypothetical protein